MTDVRTELDEYARDALLRLVRYSRERERVEEERRKARDQLVGFLESRDATVGTMQGHDICKLARYPREVVDVTRLRAEEPFMFRRFGKLSWVTRLDVSRDAPLEALIAP